MNPCCCPLTGQLGHPIRSRQPSELAESYNSYCGAPLPNHIVEKYFTLPITEYYLKASGLRWYVPGNLGDGEYYSILAEIYPWYYNPGSWDKQAAVDIISRLNPANILEVGCGDGWLLDKLRERKLNAYGVEINESAVKKCRERGLKVFLPGEKGLEANRNGVLCLLQTIEHIPNPREFLAALIQQYQPQKIVLSAPCFESLLGYTKDPLSWPPHHATAWSRKAFETLADLLGYSVSSVSYSPLSYAELNSRFEREGIRKLPSIPYIPIGRLGDLVFKIYQRLGKTWACRGHSILVVFSRKN